VLGLRVPVARRLSTRLLGLALLDRERAGPGLLIPRCRSIHTFGMRFPLDVALLDGEGHVIALRRGARSGRVVGERRARAVLEVPSAR
jgi:hypothetical protein